MDYYMQYVFEVIDRKNNEYRVAAKLYFHGEKLYSGIFSAKYIDGMVLLDLEFIKKEFENDSIRRNFIDKFKEFIKEQNS